ncbi:hypothetical protein [Paraburkholderia xenovorans]|uniref:hypothetical protein n=1 Tax=Paraburkholderia xenovorans TaxID=36873 RepID=UPI0038B89F58
MGAAIVTENEGLEPLLLEKPRAASPSTICCVIPDCLSPVCTRPCLIVRSRSGYTHPRPD